MSHSSFRFLFSGRPPPLVETHVTGNLRSRTSGDPHWKRVTPKTRKPGGDPHPRESVRTLWEPREERPFRRPTREDTGKVDGDTLNRIKPNRVPTRPSVTNHQVLYTPHYGLLSLGQPGPWEIPRIISWLKEVNGSGWGPPEISNYLHFEISPS